MFTHKTPKITRISLLILLLGTVTENNCMMAGVWKQLCSWKDRIFSHKENENTERRFRVALNPTKVFYQGEVDEKSNHSSAKFELYGSHHIPIVDVIVGHKKHMEEEYSTEAIAKKIKKAESYSANSFKAAKYSPLGFGIAAMGVWKLTPAHLVEAISQASHETAPDDYGDTPYDAANASKSSSLSLGTKLALAGVVFSGITLLISKHYHEKAKRLKSSKKQLGDSKLWEKSLTKKGFIKSGQSFALFVSRTITTADDAPPLNDIEIEKQVGHHTLPCTLTLTNNKLFSRNQKWVAAPGKSREELDEQQRRHELEVYAKEQEALGHRSDPNSFYSRSNRYVAQTNRKNRLIGTPLAQHRGAPSNDPLLSVVDSQARWVHPQASRPLKRSESF